MSDQREYIILNCSLLPLGVHALRSDTVEAVAETTSNPSLGRSLVPSSEQRCWSNEQLNARLRIINSTVN